MCTVQIKLSLAEASERKWSEVEIPDAVVDLFHSDVLPGEDVADAEAGLIGPLAPVALESYASCLANAPDFEVAGVLHLRALRGVVVIGCGVARRGRFVVERHNRCFGLSAPAGTTKWACGWWSRRSEWV